MSLRVVYSIVKCSKCITSGSRSSLYAQMRISQQMVQALLSHKVKTSIASTITRMTVNTASLLQLYVRV
jgi:hypothetical protein